MQLMNFQIQCTSGYLIREGNNSAILADSYQVLFCIMRPEAVSDSEPHIILFFSGSLTNPSRKAPSPATWGFRCVSALLAASRAGFSLSVWLPYLTESSTLQSGSGIAAAIYICQRLFSGSLSCTGKAPLGQFRLLRRGCPSADENPAALCFAPCLTPELAKYATSRTDGAVALNYSTYFRAKPEILTLLSIMETV